MAPEPAQPAADAPVRDKLRFRFRKDGVLRLVSHHDLMRCFERMLRRAELPFRTTQGFHPKPRIVFALSLPLGIVGADEIVELELSEILPPETVRERLARQCPPGLTIRSAERIPFRTTARVRRVTYRVPLSEEQTAGLADRARALLSSTDCSVERTRPHPKKINLRPFLDQLRALPGALEMDLFVLPAGTARPDEVLGLLGLSDVASVVERTRLELHEETTS